MPLVENLAAKLTAALAGSSFERRDQLLRPRKLVDDTLGSPQVEDAAELYLRAGQAVLRMRCGLDTTAPLEAIDVTSPQYDESIRRDRTFLDERDKLADGGRVWLLFEYTGREYEEIATLLGMDEVEVFELAERATDVLR